jgi:hypothetical protein
MEMLISTIIIGLTIFLIYRMVKEYKKSQIIDEKVLFWIFTIIVFFPMAVYYLDYYNIPSKFGWGKNLDLKIWLNNIFIYGVTILAAGIGAFVTIRSVMLSIEEQGRVRTSENKKKALPLLRVSEEKEYDYRYKYIQFSSLFTEESKVRERKDIIDTAKVTIKIENVGMRELYDLWIGDIDNTFFKENNGEYQYHNMYPVIYKDDYVCINLCFYEMGNYDNDNWDSKYHTLISPMSFNCYFRDCYDNWYYQTLQISLMHQVVENSPINQRALNISVSNAQIISPPIEIGKKDLPWENGKSINHHM